MDVTSIFREQVVNEALARHREIWAGYLRELAEHRENTVVALQEPQPGAEAVWGLLLPLKSRMSRAHFAWLKSCANPRSDGTCRLAVYAGLDFIEIEKASGDIHGSEMTLVAAGAEARSILERVVEAERRFDETQFDLDGYWQGSSVSILAGVER